MANLGFCKIVDGSLTPPTNAPYTEIIINKSICFYPVIFNICRFKMKIKEQIGGGTVISIPKAMKGKTSIYLGVAGSPEQLSFGAYPSSSNIDIWGILQYRNISPDIEFDKECTINMISIELM